MKAPSIIKHIKRASSKNHIGQIKEQHVTNQLSKFQLKQIVHKPGNSIFQKLCKLEKNTRPTTSPNNLTLAKKHPIFA